MCTEQPHKHADNSASNKVPHKHAELIKAWADGAVIQAYSKSHSKWFDVDLNEPSWKLDRDFRIKPEPKPDIMVYGMLALCKNTECVAELVEVNLTMRRISTDTIKATFDGETRKLKAVEIL